MGIIYLRRTAAAVEISEIWGYPERANDSACPLIPAEVLQFGPPRSQKVRGSRAAGSTLGLLHSTRHSGLVPGAPLPRELPIQRWVVAPLRLSTRWVYIGREHVRRITSWRV